MKKLKRFVISVTALFISVSLFAQKASITILETSDIHGAIAPWDYSSDKSTENGLAKAAAVINQQRKIDPNLILVDCGDNVQDNIIQEFRNDKIHPMIGTMNLMGYDAHILGNHEFNFEFKNLEKNIRQFKAPVVTANIYKKNGKRWQKPYIIKEVNGIKVAIIGILAPNIDRWEASNPEHYNNMKFTTPMEEIGKVADEIGNCADVIVAVSHYGVSGEYGVQGMEAVSSKYADKIPVYLIGHAHSVLNYTTKDNVLIMEPGAKGSYVAKVVMDFEKQNGKWQLLNKSGELLPVKGVEPDPTVMEYINPIHEKSRQIANTVIGKVEADFLPSLWWKNIRGIPTAVLQDTAMIDLINKVQMKETGADVSLSALFILDSNLTQGDFKKRDGVKIYKYDNTLMAVKVSGAELKKIMEHQAGSFFNQFKEGDVTISFNPNIRLYSYDMFAGVNYEIDISKPVGERIQNVTYKGEPLKDEEELILAMNNYRYGGLSSSGYISSSTSPDVLVYNSGLAIRDLISDYVAREKVIYPECDNNWKITGFSVDEEKAAEIYKKLQSGEMTIHNSSDGRTPNVRSVNIYDK